MKDIYSEIKDIANELLILSMYAKDNINVYNELKEITNRLYIISLCS